MAKVTEVGELFKKGLVSRCSASLVSNISTSILKSLSESNGYSLSRFPTLGPPDVYWINVDYSSFKLFHLSVLFRAGVSTLSTYKEVSLGKHQEILRQLLLNKNPGEFWQYPIFGYAVVHHKTNALIPMVSQAQQSSIFGQRCYGIMYGGAEWWICVSSHRNHEFEKVALQPNGSMPFHAVPWNELAVVQSASEALRNAHS